MGNRLRSWSVQHGGLTTSYYDEGEGEALLLVHGFTGSKLDFHDEVKRLAERYRVIVPDHRGHGESTKTSDEETYTIAQLVTDLNSFTDALGIDRFHLLGHSLGGMVAMQYALDFQHKLASLILMDTSSRPMTDSDMFKALGALFNGGGPEAVLSAFQQSPRGDEQKHAIEQIGEEEYWLRILEKWTQLDFAAFLGLGDQLFTRRDMTDELAAITVPTTVMVGVADVPFVDASKAMAETIPDASLAMIEDAAHEPQFENVAAWRNIIDDHLARVSEP